MRSARTLAAAVLAIAIGAVASLHAQTPGGDATRPITLVVPIAAGGGMDTIGRVLAELCRSGSSSRWWSRIESARAA